MNQLCISCGLLYFRALALDEPHCCILIFMFAMIICDKQIFHEISLLVFNVYLKAAQMCVIWQVHLNWLL